MMESLLRLRGEWPAPLRSLSRAIRKITRLPRHCLTLLRLGIKSPRRLLRTQAEIEAIAASGLFNITWYFERNDDVGRARIDPVLHYLLFGGAEGRDPNELFDSNWYLQQNSDVRAAGINPLLHYLRHGAAEGRDPHPLFDTARYLANHPDVSAAGINPLSHYLQYGAHEMRAPNSRTLQNDGAVAASAVGFAPVPPESFGYFERVEDGCISGWSCDAIGSAAPVIVLVNGVVAATVMAGHQNRFEIRLRLVPGDRVEVLNGYNRSRLVWRRAQGCGSALASSHSHCSAGKARGSLLA